MGLGKGMYGLEFDVKLLWVIKFGKIRDDKFRFFYGSRNVFEVDEFGYFDLLIEIFVFVLFEI